jgi:hypothetical protein
MIDPYFMGRNLRIAEGGFVYHVLNRGNGRRAFLNKAGDFAAFERILAEAKQEVPMRILAYCLLPNHLHLLLWPQEGWKPSSKTEPPSVEILVENGTTFNPPSVNWYTCFRTSFQEEKDGFHGPIPTHSPRPPRWHGH